MNIFIKLLAGVCVMAGPSVSVQAANPFAEAEVEESRMHMTLKAIDDSCGTTRDYITTSGATLAVGTGTSTSTSKILVNPLPKYWENWYIIEQVNQAFNFIGPKKKAVQKTNFEVVRALNYNSSSKILNKTYNLDVLDLVLPVFPTKKLSECTYADLSGTGTTVIDPCQIRSICLPNNLAAWPPRVLDGCKNLIKISAQGPTSSTSITLTAGHNLGCLHRLESFEIPATVRKLGDTTQSTEDKKRIVPINVKSLTFPDTITSIGSYAAYSCSLLTTLVLTNKTSLTTISSGAFRGCTALTSVDVSGCTYLSTISSYAFYGCTSLMMLDATGTRLSSIGTYAFYDCPKLVCIILPTTLTSSSSIGSYAFASTTSSVTPSSPVKSVIWRGSSRPSGGNSSYAFGYNSLSTLISKGKTKEHFVS